MSHIFYGDKNTAVDPYVNIWDAKKISGGTSPQTPLMGTHSVYTLTLYIGNLPPLEKCLAKPLETTRSFEITKGTMESLNRALNYKAIVLSKVKCDYCFILFHGLFQVF